MFKWLKRRKRQKPQPAGTGDIPQGIEIVPSKPRVPTVAKTSSGRPEPPPAPMPVGRDVCLWCKTGYKTDREYANAVCEKTGFKHASPEHLLKTEELRLRGQ